MKRIPTNRFWTIIGVGYATVALSYVIFVGPFHSRIAKNRRALTDISKKLEQYHKRGRAVVNEQWIDSVSKRLETLQGNDERAKKFFTGRTDPAFESTPDVAQSNPAEFKLAYLSAHQKLMDLARQQIQLPESGPLQSHDFSTAPVPESYSRLFQELWLQTELIKVLGRAKVNELISIRIPRDGEAPITENYQPMGSVTEIPFALECRLPASAIPVLLNQLVRSLANIVPETLKVTTAASKVMHLKLTARAVPIIYTR